MPLVQNKRWPAFMPVILVSIGLICCGKTVAQSAQANEGVYKVVLGEESRIERALVLRNAASLKRAANVLGSIVDRAIAKKQKGIPASSCEFAAQSLANVAIFVERGMRGDRGWQRITLEASVAEANQFAKNMSRCEHDAAAKPRGHLGVAKVLKALSKNGKS